MIIFRSLLARVDQGSPLEKGGSTTAQQMDEMTELTGNVYIDCEYSLYMLTVDICIDGGYMC